MPRILHKAELQKSDVLLKLISPGASVISRAIGFGQRVHVRKFLNGSSADYTKHIGFDPSCVSHAALAMGNGQIMEFDGSQSVTDTMKFKGAGVVYDKEDAPVDRANKHYIVIRCLNQSLANRVWNKALSIQCHSAVVNSFSFGIRKLISSSLFFSRGSAMNDAKVEKIQHKMSGTVFCTSRMRRNNMFCSEFVTTCYLWAALDMSKIGEMASVESLLGTADTRLSPGELGVRMLTTGANHFVNVGVYNG